MKIVTQGVNHAGLIGLGMVVLAVVGVLLYTNREQIMTVTPIGSDQGRVSLPAPPSTHPPTPSPTTDSTPELGVYQVYSAERVAGVPADARVVLFFSSPRCRVCQDVDEALYAAADEIPADLYLFEVSYERELELRRQYGVTAPHTFVALDSLGQLQERWTGSLSLDSILARL